MTEAQTADGTPAPAPLSPVEKLEKQDERNKEIALERTVEDTKKQILEADITGGMFKEPFEPIQLIAFAIIWIGLIFFSYGEYTEVRRDKERPAS